MGGIYIKVTIKDIANACGVSKTTVSRYINSSGYVSVDVSKKIEKAINDMNYIPSASARSLSTRQSKVVGVIVPEANNTFFGEAFTGISQAADENDLIIMYFNTDDDAKKEIKALNMLRMYDICGLIITPSILSCEEGSSKDRFIDAVNALNVPVVLFDRELPKSNFYGVFSDNYRGAYDATKALIDNGHTKIATITGDMSLQLGVQRNKGFVDAIDEAGLNKYNITFLDGDFTLDTAYQMTTELMDKEYKPTAIFSPNNMTTIGILKALYVMNIKIPDEIAVVGFDDIKLLNDLSIPITTVKRNAVQMGVKCMELLNELMQKGIDSASDEMPKSIIMENKLILRGSEKYNG